MRIADVQDKVVSDYLSMLYKPTVQEVGGLYRIEKSGINNRRVLFDTMSEKIEILIPRQCDRKRKNLT